MRPRGSFPPALAAEAPASHPFRARRRLSLAALAPALLLATAPALPSELAGPAIAPEALVFAREARDVVVADLDGDDSAEWVAALADGNVVARLKDGSFRSIPIEGARALAALAGEIGGDALVVAFEGGGVVVVDGAGDALTPVLGVDAVAVATGDLSGDGRPDIVLARSGGGVLVAESDLSSPRLASSLEARELAVGGGALVLAVGPATLVALDAASGVPSSIPVPPVGGVAIADLDVDRALDLAVSAPGCVPTLALVEPADGSAHYLDLGEPSVSDGIFIAYSLSEPPPLPPCEIVATCATLGEDGVEVSWTVADEDCECTGFEVRGADGDVLLVAERDARSAVVSCETLAGRTSLCVICLGPDNGTTKSCCDVEPCPSDGSGGQVPGDCNQDSVLDLSDGICVLSILFLGEGSPPCSDDFSDPSNRRLLDWNDDNAVDLSDGVSALVFLFSGGPPHVLGSSCVPVEGCPELCAQDL